MNSLNRYDFLGKKIVRPLLSSGGYLYSQCHCFFLSKISFVLIIESVCQRGIPAFNRFFTSKIRIGRSMLVLVRIVTFLFCTDVGFRFEIRYLP